MDYLTCALIDPFVYKYKMKRNNKIVVRLTTEEKEKLQMKAEKIGLSISQYSRLVLLSATPKYEE